MKKILFISILSTLSLFACPDLSIKSNSSDLSNSLDKGLSISPEQKQVVIDIISHYNNSGSYTTFLTEDSLKAIYGTKVFSYLFNIKLLLKNASMTPELQVIQDSYTKTINNINSKNSNWCNSIEK